MNDSSSPAPTHFETITIVGVGLIGGSLGLALRRAGFAGRIVGLSSPKAIAFAIDAGIIDEGAGYDDLADAASASDLVVLAGPIQTIIDQLGTIGALGERLKPGLIVTDVGSTKRSIIATAEAALPEHVHFVGGHPLAGSEQRGVKAADPFLFHDAYYVVTPAPSAVGAPADRLAALLATIGARVVVLDAAEHDRVAATISHVPQLLSLSLVKFLDQLGESREYGKRLAAGGFRDMTRIASSPFSVWRDIIGTNRDVIRELLEAFLKSTRELLGDLEDDRLEAVFDAANRARSEIPLDTRGFLSRLWNVLVVVEDKPGMIVDICNPLFEKGMNVKDIEILKVREGEGGSLRLSFVSRELADAAASELTRLGYTARLCEE